MESQLNQLELQGTNTQGTNTQGTNTQGTNTQGTELQGTNTQGTNTQVNELLRNESQEISPKKKFLQRLKNLHENLSTTKKDTDGKDIAIPNWGIDFAYYIIFVLALADISIYVDLWVNNPNVILGVHVTRIVFLVSALILAIISFAKGWRGTMIYKSTDIIVKLLSFGITLGYLISMAVKVHGNKSAGEIFRLVLSAILTIVSAVFAIMAIKSKITESDTIETPVVMYQIIILAIIAILLSVVSIIKRNSKDETSNIPLSGLRK